MGGDPELGFQSRGFEPGLSQDPGASTSEPPALNLMGGALFLGQALSSHLRAFYSGP